nr:tigger transposable element-derived protein 1-like isoform X2 [Procambarus clarkii]
MAVNTTAGAVNATASDVIRTTVADVSNTTTFCAIDRASIHTIDGVSTNVVGVQSSSSRPIPPCHQHQKGVTASPQDNGRLPAAASPSLSKNEPTSLEFILHVLDRIKNGESVRHIASEYNLALSSIECFKKNEAELRRARHLTVVPRKIKFIEYPICRKLESTLALLLRRLAEKGIYLCSREIEEQARQIYRRISGDRYLGEVPLFSAGWVERFKKCFSISKQSLKSKGLVRVNDEIDAKMLFSRVPKIESDAGSMGPLFSELGPRDGVMDANNIVPSEVLSNVLDPRDGGNDDAVNVAAAREFIPKLLDLGDGYSPDQVFNADVTGLYWKRLPSGMFIGEEQWSPELQASKDPLTLLLCANASGNLKLKPMLIYHLPQPYALKGTMMSRLPVLWRSNKMSCLTAFLLEDWFVNYVIPTLQNYFLRKNLSEKALILVDNAPCHPEYLNDIHDTIKVIFLPKHATSLIQPRDQGVVAQFKRLYLKSILQKLLSASGGKHATLAMDFWKLYTIKDCIVCVHECWSAVTKETLNSVWQNLWLDVVKDFPGFSDTKREVQEIVDIARSIPSGGFSNITREDVNEYLDSHGEELSVDDMNLLSNIKVEELAANFSAMPDVARLQKEDIKCILEQLHRTLGVLNQDPDVERSAKVCSLIARGISVYTEAYLKHCPSKETERTSFTTPKDC